MEESANKTCTAQEFFPSGGVCVTSTCTEERGKTSFRETLPSGPFTSENGGKETKQVEVDTEHSGHTEN